MLCRLFKKNELKQDENVESSHLDEVEQLVSSPAVGKSPTHGELSEAVAPSAIMGSDGNKSNPPKTSGGKTHDTRLSIDSCGNSCTAGDAEDLMLDITSVQVSRAIPISAFFLNIEFFIADNWLN